MIGIYFSGTGNTKFCIDKFMAEYDDSRNSFSIEEEKALAEIKISPELVIGYPVQYSNIPKILRDYIDANRQIWSGKRIFIIATMGLFSGDGAGILARLLRKYGATIIGGLHLKMPDSICDEKMLKRSLEQNRKLVKKAEEKISRAVCDLKNGRPSQDGLGTICHLAGLLGQRLYFFRKTMHYTDRIKINHAKCIGCGLCEKLCPTGTLSLKNGFAAAGDQCTMCYRCISKCPKQAITLLGKQVIEQNDINKYI